MIELPLSVELEVETDSEYEMEVDTAFTQGGATNFVEGSFVVGTDTTQIIELPYTGNGYPIACAVWIDGGVYSPTESSISTAPIYTIAQCTVVKEVMKTAPDFTRNLSINKAIVSTTYKMYATYWSVKTAVNDLQTIYYTDDPVAETARCIKFNSNTLMKLYTGGGSYSFAQGYTYKYFVVYSE